MAGMETWNVFQLCKCLKVLGKVMILLVLFFVAVTCFAVVDSYIAFIRHAGSGPAALAIAFIAIFLALVVMLLWAYFACVATDPGGVPPGWHPFASHEEAMQELDNLALAQHEPGQRLAGTGRPRYCKKCEAWKPERAHHDAVGGRCVLRMDHHCVWVVNCVGLLNYKAFLLFLAYTWTATGLAAGLLAARGRAFFDAGGVGPAASLARDSARPAIYFIAFVVDLAFFLSLSGFLALHARLVALNCTTIEMYEKRRVAAWPYNRGTRNNFREVFGASPCWWFLPVHSRAERAAVLDSALAARPLLAPPGRRNRTPSATEFAAIV